MRRRVPSIESLSAFEASARHLSFTRAADALSLTQSAVFKQVAVLEDYLGVRLFNRIKKRISLTEAGQVYLRQVSDGLDRLERDTVAIMTHRGEGDVLELAVIPTFATRWLIPRLPDFQRQHPGITVNLTTRAQPFLFTDTGFDAAVHFGSAQWPGAVSSYLFDEEMIPVMAPAMLQQRPCPEPAALAAFPLLHQSARHHAWRRWFEVAGVSGVEAIGGPRFELFSMLAEAARAGLGVALVPRFLVQSELASGELVAPFEIALTGDLAYYLTCPENRQDRAALQHFSHWLIEQADAYRASLSGEPAST
ncbi:transcriptional regulator GcvA [Denitromonas iodatirespirans]|uniref:Transcriptional regulator GcvA n=1 Tax=Denitromonas iodatirespirans TaxID=2795389 RepID=A0A944HDK8_DENI1|nr:transcriptional regulator GcvA [Denitromonas iodatirespirans]MBT0963847.1 transcriptional regulator GcvA [Denitromonas iodatirespirans]